MMLNTDIPSVIIVTSEEKYGAAENEVEADRWNFQSPASDHESLMSPPKLPQRVSSLEVAAKASPSPSSNADNTFPLLPPPPFWESTQRRNRKSSTTTETSEDSKEKPAKKLNYKLHALPLKSKSHHHHHSPQTPLTASMSSSSSTGKIESKPRSSLQSSLKCASGQGHSRSSPLNNKRTLVVDPSIFKDNCFQLNLTF